jgi:tetratricopeptide (TPR) repeat protein
MSENVQQHTGFESVYEQRKRASLEDARLEAEAVVAAIKRISDGAGSFPASQNLAAGKLYEIANEFGSAETAYRRALAADLGAHEAAARLVIVLAKQRRLDEAIRVGNDLFAKVPTAVFKSLVHQGPLSLCTVLGDVHRLTGDFVTAAGLYREGAKLEGNTPYAFHQAVVTMALAGESKDIASFAAKHSSGYVSERVASVVRLSQETDSRLAVIKQVAARANVGAMEAMWVNPIDLVSF